MILQFLPWIFINILYAPILYQLYHSRWETIDYTHAYFILPVSLWLLWRKRKQLATLSQIPKTTTLDAKALALLSLGLLMFVLGWRKDFLFVSTLSLIPTLFGLTLYLYGAKITRAATFPILYLLLLVPVEIHLIFYARLRWLNHEVSM